MADAVKRRYDASRRQAGARRTRGQVLEAARRLFVEGGYAETTVTTLAADAGVSPETVYATFGSKAGVLKALFDVTVVGDDEPVGLVDREVVRRIRDEPDARLALARYAAFVAEVNPRLAPVQLLIESAAPGDPAIAALTADVARQRLHGMSLLAAKLADEGALATGVSADEARDVLWTTNSAQVFDLLVNQRGWPLPRYQRWLASTWEALLLGD
jgi:AcrR family transcriptional regulator